MSTTKELRRPAAIVLKTGAEEREMVGGWKELKSVLRVVERRGSGNSGGRMRRRRREEEPVTRYLHQKVSGLVYPSYLMRSGRRTHFVMASLIALSILSPTCPRSNPLVSILQSS